MTGHGVTLAMRAIKRPVPEYLHEFKVTPVKIRGEVVFYAKTGDWSPYTTDDVSRTKGRPSKFPRPRRARELRAEHPHPWRAQLAAAKAGV